MLITLFKQLLLPPAIQLGLMLAAVICYRRWRRCAWVLVLVAWSSLLLFSIPIVSSRLFHWLEAPYIEQASITRQHDAQVIVILGGGRKRNNPEYGGDQVSHHTLWRLRYGARLAKQLRLPVIVSGGRVYPFEQLSEAELAKSLLTEEWGVETVWLEDNSRNTWENAHKTAALLREKSIDNIILVTHAYHMRRAQRVFEATGLSITPMATGFISTDIHGWVNDYIPRASALLNSRKALHEYLGLLFYWLRGG